MKRRITKLYTTYVRTADGFVILRDNIMKNYIVRNNNTGEELRFPNLREAKKSINFYGDEKPKEKRYAALELYNGTRILSRAKREHYRWLIGGDVLKAGDKRSITIFSLDDGKIYQLKGNRLVFTDYMSDDQKEWFNEHWHKISSDGIIEDTNR